MDTENVWDYPRPPRLEPFTGRLRVEFAGDWIAESAGGYRVLETSHAPTYYLPPDDIRAGVLVPTAKRSMCEWKGQARYFDVTFNGRTAEAAAWAYDAPTSAFRALAGYVAFYAEPMDACFVGSERVTPQPGNFYGGWVTANLVGPIKGEAGTLHW
jgi:uncharacterized protein (DUF427 family)